MLLFETFEILDSLDISINSFSKRRKIQAAGLVNHAHALFSEVDS